MIDCLKSIARKMQSSFAMLNKIRLAGLIVLVFFLSGCAISKEFYQSSMVWDTIPVSHTIEASARIEAECNFTPELTQFWKSWMNTDENIANYKRASCDAITQDMMRSRLFTQINSSVGSNYDLLLKLISTESKEDIKMALSVIDPKGSELIASYNANANKKGVTFSAWNQTVSGILSDIRTQIIADYQEGKNIKNFLANKKAQPPTLYTQQTPTYSVVKSDVDTLPAIKTKPDNNAYAIVIGIENYRQKLPKADFATHDAQIITEYLTRVMGYPEENVVTLLNDRASMSDITKYFEKWLSNNVEKDGTVFIYYSGHGAPNPKTGDAYLVPYDGDPSFIDQTGYSLKRLYENLNKLQAKEIIVALDSCFSGAGGRSVIAKGARPLVMSMESPMISQKIAVLSAASGDQISSTYDEKGHGLFTYFMLKGIKGEGDINGDGVVEIGEMFSYIKPNVERIARKVYNNEQSPQLIAPNEKQRMFLIENVK